MEVTTFGALSDVDRLTRVLMKHPRDAFVDQSTIDGQWEALNFPAPPDLARAVDEFEHFVELVRSSGSDVLLLPRDPLATLDSIYTRDASIVSPRGLILCEMGKPMRAGEPVAQERALRTEGGFPIYGRIQSPGTLEGGDVVWVDAKTMLVSRGYRTNAAGIRQLHDLLGSVVDIIEVPLPHWLGPTDVMHLMSIISPVDHDLAVVYSRLLPVPFRQWLLQRGFRLIEVPDDEFETMGTNVLAIAPRRCIVLSGNPRTRAALERAGCEVLAYEGMEISVKGAGGPTCLTRPLMRST